jgi:hypothetical protein
MASIFVIALIFYIFFRQELANVFKHFDQKHPYIMIVLILFLMSYIAWYNHAAIIVLVNFIYYNVTQLQAVIAHMMHHLFPKWQTIMVFNLIVRLIIFGVLLFFPQYYQKKYNSLVYQAQVRTVQTVCYFVLLIFVLIFSAASL